MFSLRKPADFWPWHSDTNHPRVLLVQCPPCIIVHLPARSSDIEHILLPQRRVLVEDGNDGPLEITDALRCYSTAHGLAAVERVLLRYGTVEAAGGVTRVELDLEWHLGLLEMKVLEAEGSALRGSAEDGGEGDGLFLFVLLVEGDSVRADTCG